MSQPEASEEVIALRSEVERLRAIVAGRATPPTDAEIAAHAAAGGRWLVALVSLRSGVTPCEVVRLERRSPIADAVDRWIALDATGRPCSWPTTGGGL